jgi:hypothetical protein
MKRLVCGTVLVMTLALASPGPAEAQSPPAVQPGAPETHASPPSPYVVPLRTPPAAVKKKTVRRKTRLRSQSSSNNIANQLNAQELVGRAHAGPMAPYGGPMRPMPIAGPGYPPPPPPVWYPPPPRPWGPWWRPWRPWRPYWGW